MRLAAAPLLNVLLQAQESLRCDAEADSVSIGSCSEYEAALQAQESLRGDAETNSVSRFMKKIQSASDDVLGRRCLIFAPPTTPSCAVSKVPKSIEDAAHSVLTMQY